MCYYGNLGPLCYFARNTVTWLAQPFCGSAYYIVESGTVSVHVKMHYSNNSKQCFDLKLSVHTRLLFSVCVSFASQ